MSWLFRAQRAIGRDAHGWDSKNKSDDAAEYPVSPLHVPDGFELCHGNALVGATGVTMSSGRAKGLRCCTH